jgi:hypothetical protein
MVYAALIITMISLILSPAHTAPAQRAPSHQAPSGQAPTHRAPAHDARAARRRPAAVTVVAAGDIACPPGARTTPTACRQRATAALIGRIHPSVVLPLGDLVYPGGALRGFTHSYARSWGRFKAITRPVPGNHDYRTPGARGYYRYFGRRATPRQPRCRAWCAGYYAYRIGQWHVVALNSECWGRCRPRRQAAWLAHDLRVHQRRCTLAYLHKPLFSGGFGATPAVRGLWRILNAHHADLVLAGHAHNYQRFVPLSSTGRATSSGITEIVAGTGGDDHQRLRATRHETARVNRHFGVVRLSLGAGQWSSRFVAVNGSVFDRSTGRCH